MIHDDPFATLRARAGATRARVVFAEGHDERVRAAAETCADLGVRAMLLDVRGEGTPRGVDVIDHTQDLWARRLRDAVSDLPRWREMEPDAAGARLREPLLAAAALVRGGFADGAIGGATHTTADVIRAGLSVVGRASGVSLVSSAFVMVLPDAEPARSLGRRAFVFADCGVIPQPSAEALVDIAVAAAHTCRTVLREDPVVALLSYSTHGSAEGPPVDIVRQAVRLLRARAPHLAIDGELQADAALVSAVAERKCPESRVAGRVNVLVFPSLDAANIAYKMVERMAGAQAVGPLVQGLARPFHDLSRGARVDDITLAACIAAVQSDTATMTDARA